MKEEYFQFKEFRIKQKTASVFKVNTEAVLISAWTSINKVSTILEIGSGTGVISLGLNQRFKNTALPNITAIDIDSEASNLSKQNCRLNEVNNIDVLNLSLEAFSTNNNMEFDLIISNPPYFDTKLKSDKRRNVYSKYMDTLNYESLIRLSKPMLSNSGIISLIVPYTDLSYINRMLSINELFITRQCNIKSRPSKEPFRVMIQIGSNLVDALSIESLCIKDSNECFTNEYKILTKDYYLKF